MLKKNTISFLYIHRVVSSLTLLLDGEKGQGRVGKGEMDPFSLLSLKERGTEEIRLFSHLSIRKYVLFSIFVFL